MRGFAYLEEIAQKWSACIAHVFLLHGNVGDTINGYTIKDQLLKTDLFLKRDIVICYDRSSGITFPIPSQRERFYAAIDMEPPEEDMLPRDPVAAFRLIEQVIKQTKEAGKGMVSPLAAVIINFAESVFPNNDLSAMSSEDRTAIVTLQRWAKEPEFVQVGPPVILITENLTDIHPSLRGASSRVEAVKVPLPDYEERKEYILSLAARRGIQIEAPDRAAALTAGLKRVHIEDIILRAKAENKPVTAGLIKERKDEIVRQEFADVLELIDPDKGFESVGGMESVKSFFQRNIIQPMKNGNYRRVPVGVLMPGPPGTGKSWLATCVAKESQINCAKLDFSKIFDSYVGSSERNLSKALDCLQALSPVLVICDEIDQSGLNRENSGDSGVSNRLFKKLLEFMSEPKHRGKIVWIGITNRPDLIDPALRRPGRFDKKIPILPPNKVERMEIFKVMFNRYGIKYDCNIDFDFLASNTEGYTGAEIEALVLKAFEIAEDSGSNVVRNEHIKEAMDLYIPTTRDIQRQVKLALQECNDKSLLPPEYRKLLEEKQKERSEPFVPSERMVRRA